MPEGYSHLELALPGFTRAREIVKTKEDSIATLGFLGSMFDFYRFVNRFRLATCFQVLRIEGFTEETASGYDALARESSHGPHSSTMRDGERPSALPGFVRPSSARDRDGHDFSVLTLAPACGSSETVCRSQPVEHLAQPWQFPHSLCAQRLRPPTLTR